MGEFKVIDLDGRWVSNPNRFPFPDPETRVVFVPGQLYKVKYTEESWIGRQIEAGVLAKAPDPLKPEKAPAPTAPPKG